MTRLFIALPLSPAVCSDLDSLNLPSLPGIRRNTADSYHITLHFIGEADVGTVEALLKDITQPPFSLSLQGVGRLESQNSEVTLTLCVQENAQLLQLHGIVAHALSPIGFRPEGRRYSPHVTLARCKSGVPAAAIVRFLSEHHDYQLGDVPIREFALFSSAFSGEQPIYRLERSFSLK